MAKLIFSYIEGYNETAYLSHENITIRHINVKINIPKSKTNQKLKIYMYFIYYSGQKACLSCLCDGSIYLTTKLVITDILLLKLLNLDHY